MKKTTVLKGTALFIGLVQLILGAGYLLAPHAFHASIGLEGLPEWAAWPMAMNGARFLLFAFGMFMVFRNPTRNKSWIQAMIMVQAIDWISTMIYVFRDVVTLSQVSTASFLPIIFITLLLFTYPARVEGDTQMNPANKPHPVSSS
ncbi:hypothetical protein ACFSUC_08885 [Marinicrinis sediminis]|uniref:DUF4345 domain-containing protein n=1 Tax=Marinicrinis sediminis TaxID=1652465 RepID=A0ABW5RAB5_9BACL